MLQVDALAKRYGQVVAVDNASFLLQPGQIVALLGRNGAGKTSLLHCIAGLSKPDTGSIRVDGISMLQNPSVAKQHLAFVADHADFFDGLTVREHVELATRLYALGSVDPDRFLEQCNLTARADIYPESLSRGEQQVLLLRLALERQPNLLVLDEPLTGLDPVVAADVKQMIRSAASNGLCVLLSSHQLGTVAELCTRMLYMVQGRVFEDLAYVGADARVLEQRFLEIHREDGPS